MVWESREGRIEHTSSEKPFLIHFNSKISYFNCSLKLFCFSAFQKGTRLSSGFTWFKNPDHDFSKFTADKKSRVSNCLSAFLLPHFSFTFSLPFPWLCSSFWRLNNYCDVLSIQMSHQTIVSTNHGFQAFKPGLRVLVAWLIPNRDFSIKTFIY